MRYLKTVLYDKRVQEAEYISDLLSDLYKHRVDVSDIMTVASDKTAVSVSFASTLCILGTREGVESAKSLGLPFVTYDLEDSESLCIILGFEDIDADLCEKWYERSRDIPWEIAITDRLVIRELSVEDDLSEAGEPWCDKEYIKDYIKNQYRLFGYGIWAVTLKEGGNIIGQVGIVNAGEDGEPELGYAIFPDFRRKGYAYEAITAVLKYVKEKLYIDTLKVCISKDNIPSEKLFYRLKSAENIDNTVSLEYTNR